MNKELKTLKEKKQKSFTIGSYSEEDIKEFIRLLKEDFEYYFDADDMPLRKADAFEIIDNLTGDLK